MKPFLDTVADEAKQIIAKLVSEGKSIEEIAKELSAHYGKEISVTAVKYFMHREFSAGESVEKEDEFTPIGDLVWLYKEQKKRVKLLRKLEDEAGLPMPETRENIALLATLLVKLIEVLEKKGEMSYEDKLKEVFGDWLKKVPLEKRL